MAAFFKKVFDAFSSFGFVVIILLFLLLLVFFGTLDQVDHGLYDTQQKYFNSLFLVHYLFGVVPLPLPGAYLLLSLLTVNLICGGMIRIRKNWRTPGILIGHAGILLMLIGGLITYHFSENGTMRLYENQASNEFVNAYEWAIEIGQPEDSDLLYVIPQKDFGDLEAGESREFFSENLPFDLTLSGFAVNASPMPAGPVLASQVKTLDGFFLQTLPNEREAEMNSPGAYVSVKSEDGSVQEGILWAFALEPLTVQTEGKNWTINLTRKRYKVPFTIVLDTFTRELHPGTGMAAAFSSDITKIEGNSNEKIKIWMNHPLRHRGYTLFQQSWGPPDAGPDEPLFTVLAVVRNPSDQWPLYSCIIIGTGLLIHFTQKLARYLRVESKRRAA